MNTSLAIAVFCKSKDLASQLEQALHNSYIQLQSFNQFDEFLSFVVHDYHTLDCLIIEDCDKLEQIQELRSHGILLPLLIIQPPTHTELTTVPSNLEPSLTNLRNSIYCYHPAEWIINVQQLSSLSHGINEAVNRFVTLSLDSQNLSQTDENASVSGEITQQQQRLSEKLKERLGYLGVYYKRNPENFLRYLSREQKSEFLEKLKTEYRQIILNYFLPDNNLNQKIDHFVHTTFFADVPVSKVVELHISLMDEFAKQLKLEGRSEEILLDYRLALIDVLAHLCEMYRRSIPRES